PSPTAAPLPTATPVPEPSATAVPFTQGTLYFIWQSGIKPAPEDMGLDEVSAKSLYAAIPGQTPDEWQIISILTDIRCFCQPKLSPDNSQLAFIQTEDSNQDGYFYTSEDRQTLYTYNLLENQLTRIDHFDFSEQFSWLHDNQSLLYKYGASWGLVSVDGSPPKALIENQQSISEGVLYEFIRAIVNSPNGQLQAVTNELGVGTATGGFRPLGNVQLALFDPDQTSMVPIFDAKGINNILATWSPDNQWLAATLIAETQEIYVIDTKTATATHLVTTESLKKRVYPPVWSAQGNWLAFIQDQATLWSWYQPTATVEQLASKNFVGSPVWSPHEDVVVVSFTRDEGGGILVVNPAEKSLAELTLDSTPIGSPIWTPDGQWLLFPARQNETTGYYLIHRQGGDVYPVFDTTGLYEPTDFFWLSD
ncbi:MAG: PD40 domain-containing protein, partial [Anaerolineales bacterium]|nr:PD40 domain-containing protein [Anaerolineales bacterium]